MTSQIIVGTRSAWKLPDLEKFRTANVDGQCNVHDMMYTNIKSLSIVGELSTDGDERIVFESSRPRLVMYWVYISKEAISQHQIFQSRYHSIDVRQMLNHKTPKIRKHKSKTSPSSCDVRSTYAPSCQKYTSESSRAGKTAVCHLDRGRLSWTPGSGAKS